MFPLLLLLLSIFVIYPKEKNKRKRYIFFFLKDLGTPGVRMQKYPKSTSIQKVSGTSTAPFLEYPCFIGPHPPQFLPNELLIQDTKNDQSLIFLSGQFFLSSNLCFYFYKVVLHIIKWGEGGRKEVL